MSHTSAVGKLIGTVDASELRTVRWGLMRPLFPRFIEELELGRYVRKLLSTGRWSAIRIEQHRLPDGRISIGQFDIYEIPY